MPRTYQPILIHIVIECPPKIDFPEKKVAPELQNSLMASSNYSLLVKVSNPLHVFVECQGHSFNKKVFRCQWIIATSGELMLFFHFKVQVRPPINRAWFSCGSQNYKFQSLYKPWLTPHYCRHTIITNLLTLLNLNYLCIMAFPVVEFSRQGYKIRQVFG